MVKIRVAWAVSGSELGSIHGRRRGRLRSRRWKNAPASSGWRVRTVISLSTVSSNMETASNKFGVVNAAPLSQTPYKHFIFYFAPARHLIQKAKVILSELPG